MHRGTWDFRDIWTSSHARICPLVITSFWVQHALWGLNPLPYHLVNVAMHAACALALWRALLALRIPGPGWVRRSGHCIRCRWSEWWVMNVDVVGFFATGSL